MSRTMSSGIVVGLGDDVFGRHQPLAHEAAHGVEQGGQGFGIADHGLAPGKVTPGPR